MGSFRQSGAYAIEIIVVMLDAMSRYRGATFAYSVASRLGSSKAMNRLGCRAFEGHRCERNEGLAFQMWKCSAEADHVYGQANVGLAYYNGFGTGVDLSAALTWYGKAADSGHPESAYNLGLMYADGIGTERDTRKAILLLTAAAKAGLQEAEEALKKLQ